MIVQNWYPQATGNAILDQILKQIMNTIYFIQASLSKQIASLPKPSSSSLSASDTGDYSGPTTQNVVTSSRSLGTVFQNTNSVPLWVLVSLSMVSSGSTNDLVTAFTDSTATPSTSVATVNLNNVGASSVTIGIPLMFLVLPGNFYKLVNSAGSASIVSWVEWF